MQLEVSRLKAIEAQLSHGIGAPPDPEYHRQMAARLLARGEEVAAQGHRLRAPATTRRPVTLGLGLASWKIRGERNRPTRFGLCCHR
jgi:hypothetical protein